MKNLFGKIESAISSLFGKMDKLTDQFESKFDNLDKSLESRVDKFDRLFEAKLKKFDSLKDDDETNDDEPEEATPKQSDDSQKRIAELEARIAELETSPDAAKGESKREVISRSKRISNSDTFCFLTSEGRVLVERGSSYVPGSMFNYIIPLRQTLIEIGEEEAVDLYDWDDASLREEEKKKSEKYQKFILQITRLATKYGAKGFLPALLPNNTVLFNTGVFMRTAVTNDKRIKF